MSLITDLLQWLLLFLVNLAVIFRRIGKLEIPAWTAFMSAAVALILLEPGGYDKAILAVGHQVDVFIFLFGMFSIVTALEMSGVLENGAKFLLNRARSGRNLLLWIHIGFGLSAALLINDTVAIMAPILLIIFARQLKRDAKPLIIAVAFTLTFGSALLPTGNPQNFILATTGSIPFLNFAIWAAIPTFIGLTGCYLILRLYYRSIYTGDAFPYIPATPERYEYEQLAKPALLALVLLVAGLIISPLFKVSMSFIILLVSSVFLFFRNERDQILARIDWGVFFFFAGMFVVIDAVVLSDIFQGFINYFLNGVDANFNTYLAFVVLIFLASQVFSNVPVAVIVAGILPGTSLDQPIFWMAAALTTTFAGATTVLGAASNIIVLETSSKRGVKISWLEFAKIGLPVSILSLSGILVLGAVYFYISSF